MGRDNPEQVPFAYKVYKRTDADGEILAAGFKQTFARDVTVEFLGVFDTVASVGVVLKKNLPFTTANSAVKTFRHALSLDEVSRLPYAKNPALDAYITVISAAQSSNQICIIDRRLIQPRIPSAPVPTSRAWGRSCPSANLDTEALDPDSLSKVLTSRNGCRSRRGGMTSMPLPRAQTGTWLIRCRPITQKGPIRTFWRCGLQDVMAVRHVSFR